MKHEFQLAPFVTAISVCSISIFINGWVYGVLSKLRMTSGSIYNMTLIRHLIFIDAITAFVEIIRQAVLFGVWRATVQTTGTGTTTQGSRMTAYLVGNQSALVNPPPTDFHYCLLHIPVEVLNATHLLTLLNLTLIAIDLYLFIIKALSYRQAFLVRYMKRIIVSIWFCVLAVVLATQLHKIFQTLHISNTKNEEYEKLYEGSSMLSTDTKTPYNLSTLLAFKEFSNVSTLESTRKQYSTTCSYIQNTLNRFCCVAYGSHVFVSSQIILAVILVSCVVLTYCYVRIVITIYTMARANSIGSSSSVHQHRRGVITAAAILLVFYALFLPYFILNFSGSINTMSYFSRSGKKGSSESWYIIAMQMDNWLRIVMIFYTILNPLIYACRLSAVRRHSSQAVTDFRARNRLSFTNKHRHNFKVKMPSFCPMVQNQEPEVDDACNANCEADKLQEESHLQGQVHVDDHLNPSGGRDSQAEEVYKGELYKEDACS